MLDRKTEADLVYRKFRDCSDACLNNLKIRLSDLLTNFSIYDALDVNIRTKNVSDLFWSAYDDCCPVKTKLISRSRLNKPWMDGELLDLCNMKHALFRRYRSGQCTFIEYNRFKNDYTSLLRRSKRNYFRDKFLRCINDIRLTWKNINFVIGSRRRVSVIDEVIYNNTKFDRPADISRAFNDYFTSVAVNLRNNIPFSNKTPLSYLGNPSVNYLEFAFVDGEEVYRTISNLPSKSGRINYIPSFIFKSVNDVIAPIICNLFNSSVIEGIFPDVLKVAEVIPLHKSGSTSDVSKYRPISLLPVLSKVFERLMRSRLIHFFESNDTLSAHQFGFRSGRDTSDAILQFLDLTYNSLDSKRHLIAVLLDLSKAFDTLDHDILVSKLSHVGVRGEMLRWIVSYLSKRKQFVTVNNNSSSLMDIEMGVPQGSVLGPLLFLIYINDMSKSSQVLNFVHFADDTTAFSSGSDVGQLFEDVNRELILVDEWLVVNKLSLNLSKTTFVLVSHSCVPDNLSISIRDQEIERVCVAKFLGVRIDDKLSFKPHIDSLCKVVSRSIGIIYKMSTYVPPSTLINLYFALVHSHLTYGITAWGGTASVHLNRLKSLQNRVVNLFPVKNNVSNFSSYSILKLKVYIVIFVP